MIANESKTPSQVFAEFQGRVRALEKEIQDFAVVVGAILTTQDIAMHSRQALAIDADKVQEVVADLQRRIEKLEARRE